MVQVLNVCGAAIELQSPPGQEGVVGQHTADGSLAVSPAVQQTAILIEPGHDERIGLLCCSDQSVIIEKPARLCHGGDHETVPVGQHLVVQEWSGAFCSDLQETPATGVQHGLLCCVQLAQGLLPLGQDPENVVRLSLISGAIDPVACPVHGKNRGKQLKRFRGQVRLQFFVCPHVERALFALAVRIFCAIEAPLR